MTRKLEARQFIRQHVNRQLTLSDIAEHVNTHPNYLSSLFSKECGTPIMRYYDEERIAAICQHLQFSEQSLAEVATHFDFSSFAYFSSYFKRLAGMSPSEYRRQMKR